MDLEDFAMVVEYGDLQSFKNLIDSDPSLVNALLPSGGRALHTTARHGFIEKTEALLSRSVDVDARNTEGETALHLAAAESKPDVVTLLLRHGADIAAVDAYDRTPLTRASQLYTEESYDEEKETFEVLRDAGAPYDIMSASYLCDVERINDILRADPDGCSRLAIEGSEFCIYGIIYSDWRDVKSKIAALEAMFSHGINIPAERLASIVESLHFTGEYTDIADYLRSKVPQP